MILHRLLILALTFFMYIELNPSLPKAPTHSFKKTKSKKNIVLAIRKGSPKLLPFKIKKRASTLTISHLFTPSGLHLYFILSIVLLFFKSKSSTSFLLVSLGIFFIAQNQYFSIIRIILFKLIKRYTNLSSIYCFYLVFLIDLILLNYKASPLSFLYSFLFLGIIITTSKKTKLGISIELMFAQIFIMSFNPMLFSPFTFLANIIYIPIFFTLFPFNFIPFSTVELVLENIHIFCISTLHKVIHPTLVLQTSFLMIFIMTLFLILNRKKKTYLMIGICCFYSTTFKHKRGGISKIIHSQYIKKAPTL
ncbi:MAG: hypothetical protein ACI9QD_000856 [Thermoproteota archaeon]|jgi:hypothetical protein